MQGHGKNKCNTQHKGTVLLCCVLYLLDGNKVSEAWAGNIKEYGYNNIGQLMYESHWDRANIEMSTIYYTYDSRGNRLTKDNDGVIEQYTYDRVNRLTGISGGNNWISYTYDDNGNMLTKNKGVYENGNAVTEETSAYSYDAFNRLTGIASGDMTASYIYNADDRRISKTVNGVTTYHIWDRDNIIFEADANKNELARYYYGRRLAISVEGSETKRYGYDPHGSVNSINGMWLYDYDSFGNQTMNLWDISKHYYCGEYYDAETGFIYLRNRYYDSSIGRFISEDPIKDGLNWYVYANNNPVKYSDPSGLDAIVANQLENIGGAGHMSSFVQDDSGTWYFFYWGNNSVSLTVVDDSSILKDAEKINTWLEEKGLSNGEYKYDGFCYILGDFSESKDYYQNLADQFAKDVENNDIGWFNWQNKNYNFVTRNCAQETMEGLYKGKIGPDVTHKGTVLLC